MIAFGIPLALFPLERDHRQPVSLPMKPGIGGSGGEDPESTNLRRFVIMNTGDTAWVLTSSILVLGMTIPGLAFFYGGLVRRKNVLSILMQCFIIVCVISLQWVLFGYSLAFGPDTGWGIIGSLKWAGLNFVGGQPNADYAATIPHQAFMIFQAMFAVITPALIIGAYAERMKFSAFLIFTVLWATLVYDPLAHWVWGTGGWLRNLGALDFAGGIVVHVSSGISALTLAVLLGKRCSYELQPFRPHNLPFTVLGAALLWFGWFGFNAGSALGANELAANAFVTTHVATAAAGLTWALIEWRHHGAPTVLGAATGAVAGLVAITPACGFVNPMNAIFIGILVALFCYIAVVLIQGAARLRRLPGRLRRSRGGRDLGDHCHGALCREGGQRRRGGRPVLRKLQTVSDPAFTHRHRTHLRCSDDLDHLQGCERTRRDAGGHER
jgi:Amt family ammonium transporter